MKKLDILAQWTDIAKEEFPDNNESSQEEALFRMNEVIAAPLLSYSTEELSLLGEFYIRKIIQETWTSILQETTQGPFFNTIEAFSEKIKTTLSEYNPTSFSEDINEKEVWYSMTPFYNFTFPVTPNTVPWASIKDVPNHDRANTFDFYQDISHSQGDENTFSWSQGKAIKISGE